MFHVPVYETPVGFKYLGNLLTEGEIAMGGEESGGFSLTGHVPDKDGILTCLLVAAALSAGGATVDYDLGNLGGGYQGKMGHMLLLRFTAAGDGQTTDQIHQMVSPMHNIPTLSEWGLIVLALLTIGIAVSGLFAVFFVAVIARGIARRIR